MIYCIHILQIINQSYTRNVQSDILSTGTDLLKVLRCNSLSYKYKCKANVFA